MATLGKLKACLAACSSVCSSSMVALVQATSAGRQWLACWPLLPLWCRQTSQAVRKVTSPQATLSRKAAHCTTMGGNHHTP